MTDLDPIDPSSRRRNWLRGTPLDGRRMAPAYVDYADAARRTATSHLVRPR